MPGFNALPASMRDYETGKYRTMGLVAYYWIFTIYPNETDEGIEIWLDSSSDARKSNYFKQTGFSIRCIKN